MRVSELWLTDFRSYEQAHVELPGGLCVVTGPNGVGKTNLLEAVCYLASLVVPLGAQRRPHPHRGRHSGAAHV
ncbi:MAG: AAA family ATPase [Microthrixaceae bacterium]